MPVEDINIIDNAVQQTAVAAKGDITLVSDFGSLSVEINEKLKERCVLLAILNGLMGISVLLLMRIG